MAQTKQLPAPPVVAKGYTNAYPGIWSGFGSWDLTEDVPELLWPMSVRTYLRMGRADTRLASVLKAIGLPIRCANWWIDPNGADDEVVEFVATSLGLPIRGDDQNKPTPRMAGRFSWPRHLQTALKYLQFGHQVFERLYSPNLDANGRMTLARLAPRPSTTIAFWNVNADGDLVAVQQWPMGNAMTGRNGEQVAIVGGLPGANIIPADRLVAYVNDPDPGVWFGNSILRPSYANWMLKSELIRIEAAAARRHGIGVPVITASEAESEDPARLSLYGQIAQDWVSGENSGLALPNGAEAAIKGPEGNMPNGFIRMAIEYHDKQMALGALLHFMNLDRGGSYALASALTDPWVQSCQAVADDIRDTTQAEVVEHLVDVNFGVDASVPLIGCDEIGSRQDATAAALQLLQSAGLLTPDFRLESFLRSQMGLPAADEDTARIPEAPGDAQDPTETGSDPAEMPMKMAPAARIPGASRAEIRVREHTRRRSDAPNQQEETLF